MITFSESRREKAFIGMAKKVGGRGRAPNKEIRWQMNLEEFIAMESRAAAIRVEGAVQLE